MKLQACWFNREMGAKMEVGFAILKQDFDVYDVHGFLTEEMEIVLAPVYHYRLLSSRPGHLAEIVDDGGLKF